MTEKAKDHQEAVNRELEPWPERLKSSAATLCQASAALQAAVTDDRRMSLLSYLCSPGDQVIPEIEEEATAEIVAYRGLLIEALAALIDLAAYDNPDREYPNLKEGFEFKCSNVVFGQNVMNFTIRRSSTP